jgi:hypothetical protein
MSDQTYEALEHAIAQHLADVAAAPLMLTDWVLSAAGAGEDAEYTDYVHAGSGPPHSREGLLRAHLKRLHHDED